MPIAANAGYYAEIVREKAILRRLVDARHGSGRWPTPGRATSTTSSTGPRPRCTRSPSDESAEDYKPLSELMQPTLDEIEAIESRGAGLSGVPTGFADLDELTNGLHPGQMIIVAARPAVGKSTLALDIARSASIKNGLTSVIFSLEMSQIEITMRLLSAEAKHPAQRTSATAR